MSGPDTSSLQAERLLFLQRSEITEHHIYTKIAAATPEPGNRDVLSRIAAQELEHYGIWKRYTGQEVAPDRKRIWFYYLVARIFGMTFAIKLMEGMEQRAQSVDQSFIDLIPEMPQMLADEKAHEQDLIALIDEERLKYIGSVVLGLNDALIEFTGTLAGFTFALQNNRVIAMAGLITGVAASLSMGASEYLSQRSDGRQTDPLKAALYTGATYILTVVLLILPYLLLQSLYGALALTLAGAVLVIFLFTFYIAVAKDLPFWRRFAEMAAICLGIAAISFVIGLVIRNFLNVTI
ncbi:MAG: VIT1/CCC1 transporter family protein [Methanoregula sp.]